MQPSEFTHFGFLGGLRADVSPRREPFPKTYLFFAKQDLANHSPRSCVNACSNAKRALHFQIEVLSDAYGFAAAKRRDNFPERLGYCSESGIIAPNLLRKLNTFRNRIEHDYYLPTDSEAEDFVEIAELFLPATDPFVFRFPTRTLLGSPDQEFDGNSRSRVTIQFLPFSGSITGTMATSLLSSDEVHRLAKEIYANGLTPTAAISPELLKRRRCSAYFEALNRSAQSTDFTIEASDGNDFFAWVRLIVSMHGGNDAGVDHREFTWSTLVGQSNMATTPPGAPNPRPEVDSQIF